jgi:hypothetical protein
LYEGNKEQPEAEFTMTLQNYLPLDKAGCLTVTKAPQFSESLVTLYQSTCPNIPEDFKTAAETSDLPVAG